MNSNDEGQIQSRQKKTNTLSSFSDSPRSIAIEFRSVKKTFGQTVANQDVSFKVEQGTIHGIIGENGAGKSTAMKMLYGLYPPDRGEIWVKGERSFLKNPSDAMAKGIGMVHQHFMLAEPMTALENIMLGRVSGPFGILNKKETRSRLDKLSSQYGLSVPWDKKIEELPVGIQQRVEILKLLDLDADILILDEPTAVLTPLEVEEFFKQLRQLKVLGKTIIIISHKLKEILEITDRVTVFRSGRVTGELENAECTVQKLADLMVGRSVMLQVSDPLPVDQTETLLELKEIELREFPGRKRKLNLSVKAGEILGIAGVEGNGQSSLLQLMMNPGSRVWQGTESFFLYGQDVRKTSTQRILDQQVSYIPEDRLKDAVLLNHNLVENFILGLHRNKDINLLGFLRWKKIKDMTLHALKKFDVRPLRLDSEVGSLSGGNQQKLVIAREFERKPKLLIAAQPTRGVDVGAIEQIHETMMEARNNGCGIILVSSELDEVLSLSDRIVVLFSGDCVGEWVRGKYDEKEIGKRMGGVF